MKDAIATAPHASRARHVGAADLASADRGAVRAWLDRLTAKERSAIDQSWDVWARLAQRPPPGDWAIWLMLGGRGAGKTRAGAEWVCGLAETGAARRIALLAPTEHAARHVMLEGPSGLMCTASRRGYALEVSQAAASVRWPNGAEAFVFSASAPDRLRGPQFDAAWGDEVAFWPDGEETLSILRLGLRLGDRPRLMLTTTPRPSAVMRALLKAPDVVVTRSRSAENAANLAAGFVSLVRASLADDVARQELDGEVLEGRSAALFTPVMIAQARVTSTPPLDRVVIAVDPPASSESHADACGIVAVGANGRGRDAIVYALEDASLHGAAPAQWAATAITLAHRHHAACIVAEANTGGEMVRAVIHGVDPSIRVKLVRAHLGKAERAAPVALHYARGRVFHRPGLAALEDEMLAFDGRRANGHSPDRLDALVWGVLDHLNAGAEPGLRAL